jgi:hypothetical protein
MLHEGENPARSKDTPNLRQRDRRIWNRAQRKEADHRIKTRISKRQGAARCLYKLGWNADPRRSRQNRGVVIDVGLYAPPSDGLRKITEAWIPAWTDLENVPVEPSQQTALTFRHRALTGVVESRQQPMLYISTPGSHRHTAMPGVPHGTSAMSI